MARKSAQSLQARRGLEQQLGAWRTLKRAAATPAGGWVRAIRQALGMSAADLAAMMQVDPSTVLRLERSERSRRVQLDTLDRVAQALDCELVYALVPRRPLDQVVDERARQLARREVLDVDHTMALEAQRVDVSWVDERVTSVAEQLKAQGRLWAVPDQTRQR